MYTYGQPLYYMSSSDSSLAPITALPYVREQIFGTRHFTAVTFFAANRSAANAVALYPHLVREEAKARDLSSSQIDPKEVFQVLVVYEKSGWRAILVYGVPQIRETLVKGKVKVHHYQALERLFYATAEMLNVVLREELHIPTRQQTSLTDHGTFNKESLYK